MALPRMKRKRKMSDETQGDEENGATPSKRTRVASREWVGKDGAKVDNKADTTGGKYTWLANGRSVTRQWFGGLSAEDLAEATGVDLNEVRAAFMCATMGWITKVGNVANTVVNAPGADPEADPVDSIIEWDDLLGKGEWREKVEGAGLPRIDKDALARAIVEVVPQDYQKVRDRLEGDRAWVREVRQHPKVLELYNQYTGKSKVEDAALRA
jgi:hypothetical protein